MQYTVVHSKDPYLLARLATDLQMDGKEYNPTGWNSDPFGDFMYGFPMTDRYRRDGSENEQDYMILNSKHAPENSFAFYNNNGEDYATRYELTSSNYIKVLTQILEP